MSEPSTHPLAAGLTSLRKALGRYRALLAAVTLAALCLAYQLIFHDRLIALVKAVLPNSIAALFVFLALYFLYNFIGIRPSDEVAQLLDKQRGQMVGEIRADSQHLAEEMQRLQVPRPRGILNLFPHWDEMNSSDWEAILNEARHLDIIMNWCDSLLEANGRTFRRLLSAGATINLYLPHPGGFGDGDQVSSEDRDHIIQLSTMYDMPRRTIRFHIAESVSKLMELGARTDQIEVRLLGVLQYSAVRIDRRHVLISHYDQFRVGHPRSHALLLDLEESMELRTYWADQFSRFEAISPTSIDTLLRLRRNLGRR